MLIHIPRRRFAAFCTDFYLDQRRTISTLRKPVGRPLDSNSYAALLRQCSNSKALAEGKKVHAHITRDGCEPDTFLANLLVQMYGSCGSISDACQVFERIRQPNKFSWNIMITAYVQNGHLENARALFDSIPQPDLVAWNVMIAAYAQKGHLLEARGMFDRMPHRDVVSWNTVIAAYIRYGYSQDAVKFFSSMDMEGTQADRITFISILDACASLAVVELGRAVHAEAVSRGFQRDRVVGTALVNMYGKCRHLLDARRVFDEMEDRDVVSWNAMVAAYAQNGHLHDAKDLFEEMHVRTAVSWNTMIVAYAHNGDLHNARSLFEEMPKPNVVSWNAMITAYTQNGHGKEALALFRLMKYQGTKPDKTTFVSVLNACGSLGDLAEGKIIHSHMLDCEVQPDAAVGTALVDMYAKGGSLCDAKNAFESIPQKDVFLWTAMLSAYALNGQVVEARRTFLEMKQRNVVSWNAIITACVQNAQYEDALNFFRQMDLEGVQPNRVTYISILEACTSISILKLVHATITAAREILFDVAVATALISIYGKYGSLETARNVFDRMPLRDVTLWTAMVAAYAQKGGFVEAIELFQAMNWEGFKPNEITYGSILSACSHAGSIKNAWLYFTSISSYLGTPPTLHHYVCMVDLLGRAGQLEKAEELINNMPFEPDSLAWRTLLAACQIHGDVKRGARIANCILELDPVNAASYILLSNVYTGGRGL